MQKTITNCKLQYEGFFNDFSVQQFTEDA